jgi:RNA-binding protein YlmH
VQAKLRLDAFLAARLASDHTASRAKVQAAIKAGQVAINGRVVDKASQSVAVGDSVVCVLLPGPSLEVRILMNDCQ